MAEGNFTSRLTNPDVKLSPEVRHVVDRMNERDRLERVARIELYNSQRDLAKRRNEIVTRQNSTPPRPGVGPLDPKTLKGLRFEGTANIRDYLKRSGVSQLYPKTKPKPVTSPNNWFYWAETEPFSTSPKDFGFDWRNDHLTFFGDINSSDDPDYKAVSFGLKATFILEWDRTSIGDHGWWRSSPVMAIDGHFHGNVHDYPGGLFNLGQDSWNKLVMYTKQHVFQVLKTGEIGFDRVVQNTEWIFDYENEEKPNLEEPLHREQYMPEMDIIGIAHEGTLISELIVQFDVQIEDAFLTLQDSMVLDTRQWQISPK